jgi:hypothetical protein
MIGFFPSSDERLDVERLGVRLDSTSVAQPGGDWRSAWMRA